MSFGSDTTPPASVPPPGFVPGAVPQLAIPVATPLGASVHTARTSDAEDAIRWRIGAAVIDNLIVYVMYLVLCLALHWRVAELGHLLVSVAIGVIYHFVMEAQTGQTIGKRRYGIRVVSADGGPADARAVAIRSVLRIIDQLPVFYVSGLINMVRTGPARRQRIGDVAAGTKVVAVDGYAAAKGTPGWLLPVATLTATAISALVLYAALTANTRPLDEAQRAAFVDGCDHSPTAQVMSCSCLLNELQANGYTSIDDLHNLSNEVAEGRAPQGVLIQIYSDCRY